MNFGFKSLFAIRSFLISKCRGDWDLGLCTFWVLAQRERLHNGKILLRRNVFFVWSRLCAAVLSMQVPVHKKCTDLDHSFLYTLMLGTHCKFARKNNFLSRYARRLHRRAALLRPLQWLSNLRPKFLEGVAKSKSVSWNDHAIFQFVITRCFSYDVVAISTWRILSNTRVDRISFICNVIKSIRLRCTKCRRIDD